MEEQCGNCRFWKRRSDIGERGGGYCRRFPPSIAAAYNGTFRYTAGTFDMEVESRMNDGWPNVHQQSWCGEWQKARPPLRG